MNKNFKEKQREKILIKLVSRYEKKINEKDDYIKGLEQKKKHKDDLIYGIKINNMYWLGVMGFNLVLFPIIGHYYIGSVIRGISMAIVSSIATGATLLLFKGFERTISKDLKKLNNDINTKEKQNEEYEKDLESLKKHITPAHIEYNINPNNTNEITNEPYINNFFVEDTNDSIETNHESYVNNYFMEDYSLQEEDETKEVEGPILVKRKKRR